MKSFVAENYLRDFGALLKEEALVAVSKRDQALPGDRPFLEGLALGYINVLSLAINQAKAFGLDSSELNLEGFNPDDLHG